MKKLLLSSTIGVAVLATALNSGAQGTVTFGGASVVTSNTVTGATAKIVNNHYEFGLYLGTTLAALQASTSPVLVLPNTGPFAGQISSAIQTIANHPAGEVDFFVIKAWDGGNTTSLESALAAGTATMDGISPVGTATLGSTAGPFTLFGVTTGSIPANSLVLTPVPEPSTLAIGGLGLAALAFFRRRK